MHERLDQLMQLQGMCTQELQHIQTNVGHYLQYSGKMLNVVQKNWHDVERGTGLSLMIYDNFMTSITNVMNCARKLNLQLQLNFSNSEEESGGSDLFGIVDVPATDDRNQGGALEPQQIRNEKFNIPDKTKTSIESSPQLQNFYPAEEVNGHREISVDFLYPKLSLREFYEIGHKLCVHVTYIKCLDEMQFYILDPQSQDVLNVSDVSQSLDLHQYYTLPPANEVFGLVLDKRILRAVRSTKVLYDLENDEELWPCYLLDFGEVVNIKLSDIKYKLTELQKMTPACAILCEVKSQKSTEAVREMLKKVEYSKSIIEIKEVQQDKLIVELEDDLGQQTTHKTAANERCAITHPHMISKKTDASSSIATETIKEKLPKVSTKSSTNTNPFTQSLRSSATNVESDSDKNKNHFLQHSAKEVKPSALTSEELEELYEEPLNTSNALKAVLGHAPQDDRRICRFYDSATGACFKGSNCKQEHVPFHPEGWTKDVVTAISTIDNRLPQIVYTKGTILNITPTFIAQLGTFYSQINDGHHNNTPLIWNDEDIKPWQRLKTPPHVFELVLSRYEDGLWYRAKILAHDDSYRKFKVFYVDYGNHQIVDIQSLAKCESGAAQAPFQAALCRWAHLQERELTKEKRNAGIKMICDLVLNKSINVKVVTHHEDLIVSPEGELNLTLKSKLVHGGYMKPF